MNKFAEWMKEKKDRKQGVVAEKIGVVPSTLHDILNDKYLPSLKVAYQIELYTDGVITLYDWLDHGEGKKKKLNKSKIQTKEKAVKK